MILTNTTNSKGKNMILTEYYRFLRKNDDSSQNTTDSNGTTAILTEHNRFLRRSYDSSQNAKELLNNRVDEHFAATSDEVPQVSLPPTPHSPLSTSTSTRFLDFSDFPNFLGNFGPS